MTRSLKICLALMFQFSLVQAQFKIGQKIISCNLQWNSKSNFEDNGLETIGYLKSTFYGVKLENNYQGNFKIGLGYERVKSAHFITGYSLGFGLNQNNQTSQYTQNGIPVFESKSRFNQQSYFVSQHDTWLYPIKEKWGMAISLVNALNFSRGRIFSSIDTSGLMVFKNYFTNLNISVQTVANLQAYYFVTPKLIVGLEFPIANVTLAASKNKYSFEPNPSKIVYDDPVSYSLQVKSNFSGSQNLTQLLQFKIRWVLR